MNSFSKKIQSSTYIKRFSHRPFIPCRELLLFSEELKPAGLWMFVIGSFQLLIRPTIRLVHDFHYRKFVESRRSKCRE